MISNYQLVTVSQTDGLDVVSACVAVARQLPGTAAAQGGPLQSYRTGHFQ